MVKRFIALIVMVVVVLTACCACVGNTSKNVSPSTETDVTIAQPAATEQTADIDVSADISAEVQMTTTGSPATTAQAQTKDEHFRSALSWKGTDGATLSYKTERIQPDPNVNVYYDKIILTGSFGSLDKINDAISSQCDAFIADNFAQIAESLTNLKNSGITEDDSRYKSMYSYTELKDVCTDGRYLSIHFFSDWCGGGVSNASDYGANYDLVTGNTLTLVDYYQDFDPETVRMNILQSVATDRGDEIADFSYIDKPLELINFYFHDDTIAINFEPYEFGFGGWSRTNEYPIAIFRTNNFLYPE